ncbi:MAG: hypothetical protein K0Q59_3580 [Paenibacillus sp.]|nr:hypothetical protein [Paenibacillus sp.]
MNKKLLSIVSIAALSLTISTSAFASPGVVDRSVNFRSAPSTNSTVYSLIKAGSSFEILEKVNSYWYKISYNGQTGYVSTDYAHATGSSGSSSGSTGVVERSVNFRSAPSTSSTVYQLISTGATFQVLEKVNSAWYKISYNGRTGYVSSDYVRVTGSPSSPGGGSSGGSPSDSSKADRIIAHAQALKGVVHYSYGVNQPTSVMDCSAFTKYVFGLEGVSLKWGTRYQKDSGSAVSKSNLQKGDLVFFWTNTSGTINHVGIYIGNGQMIHNSPSFDGVGISSITSGYWSDHYISARRVL